MTISTMPGHGRSGVVFVTVAALAAMLMTFSGCADDAPGPDTPGQGSLVATTTTASSVPAGASTPSSTGSSVPGAATTPAPNANAGGGGGAGTGTGAP